MWFSQIGKQLKMTMKASTFLTQIRKVWRQRTMMLHYLLSDCVNLKKLPRNKEQTKAKRSSKLIVPTWVVSLKIKERAVLAGVLSKCSGNSDVSPLECKQR